MRWQLHDPIADDTFTFVHNPLTMTSMAPPHTTKTTARSPIDGKIRSQRIPDHPFVWSFTGKVRTRVDYDALVSWVSRPNRLQLTDHFGRVHDVLPTKFAPTSVDKAGGGNPWLFSYTVDTLYYRRVS